MKKTDYVVMMIYDTRKRISTGNERRNIIGVSEEHEQLKKYVHMVYNIGSNIAISRYFNHSYYEFHNELISR